MCESIQRVSCLGLGLETLNFLSYDLALAKLLSMVPRVQQLFSMR